LNLGKIGWFEILDSKRLAKSKNKKGTAAMAIPFI
jgi:hypothetical protein